MAKVSVNYTIPINKSLDSVIGPDYYEWKIAGWTKCSHVCGRGKHLLFQFFCILSTVIHEDNEEGRPVWVQSTSHLRES